jgi:hypothetical protein
MSFLFSRASSPCGDSRTKGAVEARMEETVELFATCPERDRSTALMPGVSDNHLVTTTCKKSKVVVEGLDTHRHEVE